MSSLIANVLADLKPAMLIVFATYYWLITILEALLRNPGTLFSFHTLQHKAFGKMWMSCGPQMSQEMPVQIESLLRTLTGKVLDLGPGSGEQLHRYSADMIEVCYGIEPVEDMHKELKRRAEKAGFGERYRILKAGAEPDQLIPALAKAGALKAASADEGIFDAIVCVRVLCGVTKPEETIKGLYRLLKPGGRLIVDEHVVNPWQDNEGSLLARAFQFAYACMGWHLMMGNCHINRDTGKMIREAADADGHWSKSETQVVDGKTAIPFLIGTYTKKMVRSNA